MIDIKFRDVHKSKNDGSIGLEYSSVNKIEGEDSWQGEVSYVLIDRQLFTGLEDKDGVPIYEGDIFTSLYKRDGCKGLYEVCWNNDRAGFYAKKHGEHQQTGVTITMSDLTRCELIGNKYQNPELLTSQI